MGDTLLAIETSSEHCSVAVRYQDEVVYDLSTEPRGHANRLLPMIHDLLDRLGLKVSELDAIAVTNGPGAFTSIRIGTAVCQGLAAAADLPVITASSLEVMALNTFEHCDTKQCLVALDARMEEVYFGIYEKSHDDLINPVCPEQVSAPALIALPDSMDTGDWACAGIAWEVYEKELQERFVNQNLFPVSIDFPDAKSLMTLALHRWRNKQYQDVRSLRPVYLRDNVVNR